MYKNIGKNIMALAVFITGLGVALSVMAFIIIWASKGDFWLALAVMAGGSFISWVNIFFMYGFGKLVENTSILADKANLPLNQ